MDFDKLKVYGDTFISDGLVFCIIYIINENSMFAIESNSGSPEMQLSASIEVSGVRHFLQVLDVRININQSLALAKN